MVEVKDVGVITTGGTIGQINSIASGTIYIGNSISMSGTVAASGTIGISQVQSGSIGILAGSVNVLDAGPTWTPVKKFVQAIQPEGTLWTPTSTKKINVTDLIISAQAAGTIELRLQTQGTLLIYSAPVNGNLVHQSRTPFPPGSADGLLTYYNSGGTFNVTAKGFES